jgi:hypothetical protein
MEEMIAYCGLECTKCPTFLATQNNDDAARAKTAVFYSEKFGFNLKPEEINCDGCLSDGGKLISYCQTCKIRECCRGRGLENCTVCEDQPCDKLAELHKFSPDARDQFNSLVKRLASI